MFLLNGNQRSKFLCRGLNFVLTVPCNVSQPLTIQLQTGIPFYLFFNVSLPVRGVDNVSARCRWVLFLIRAQGARKIILGVVENVRA